MYEKRRTHTSKERVIPLSDLQKTGSSVYLRTAKTHISMVWEFKLSAFK